MRRAEPWRAGMQTLRALFIVALAPLVSGFGSFPEGDAKSLAKHIPKCTSAQQHVEDAHSMLHGTTPPHAAEAPGLRAATGSDSRATL